MTILMFAGNVDVGQVAPNSLVPSITTARSSRGSGEKIWMVCGPAPAMLKLMVCGPDANPKLLTSWIATRSVQVPKAVAQTPFSIMSGKSSVLLTVKVAVGASICWLPDQAVAVHAVQAATASNATANRAARNLSWREM